MLSLYLLHGEEDSEGNATPWTVIRNAKCHHPLLLMIESIREGRC
jgi:hypothetical protein